MKKFLMILMVSAVAFFLATGSALAITHVVNDNYNYWPGYEDTYGDMVGDRPTVENMYITVDNNDYLTSVAIDVKLRMTADWLLINTNGEWDSWDYAVRGGTSINHMYEVDGYEYIYSGTGRIGHPSGLDRDKSNLTEVFLLKSLGYDGNLLTYTFEDDSLKILFDVDNRPAIGYTMWCANDVFLTPIPEPATMLLLGTGLIGLAFLGRKKLFKK